MPRVVAANAGREFVRRANAGFISRRERIVLLIASPILFLRDSP
jgi:hypothetical protein